MASQSQRSGRAGLIALLTAWALVLGIIALAMVYVFLVPEGDGDAQLAATPPAPVTAPQGLDVEPPETVDESGQDVGPDVGAEDPSSGQEAPSTQEPDVPEAADAGSETAVQPPAAGEETEPPPTEPATPDEASAPDEPAQPPAQSAEAAPDTATPASPAPGPEKDEPAGTGQQVAGLAMPVPQLPDARAWQRFAVPFDERDSRPRVAVVVAGLGLADAPTEAAIKLLPSAVTLSFSPYARDLQPWIALARANGHEVMLDLPMEPVTFPADDPGPQALITTLSKEENLRRLDWILARGSAFVGLAGAMGSRFAASREQMTPVMETLKARGLLFLDNRPTDLSVGAKLAAQMGVPHAINNRSIDERQASRLAIDARLAQIERVALTEGYAVAMARPFPVTLERLSAWIKKLDERGIVLAPITALADRQSLR